MLSRDMKERTSLPIRSFLTTKEKNDLELGVNSIGVLLENDKFILLSGSDNMELQEAMKYLIDGMVTFSPSKHVEDTLMALWFANVAARELEGKFMSARNKVRTENNLYQMQNYEKSSQIII
jgi:hypothetical protein